MKILKFGRNQKNYKLPVGKKSKAFSTSADAVKAEIEADEKLVAEQAAKALKDALTPEELAQLHEDLSHD